MKSSKYKKRALIFLAAVLIITMSPIPVLALNPYMPLWEHVPDGEPYIFEDPDNPGQYRAYVYGSHDVNFSAYCGRDIPVWSAPVEDLLDWRYDGPCFEPALIGTGNYDTLFAPDVMEVYFDQKYIDYMNAHPELIANTNNPNKVLTLEEDGGKWYYMYPHNRGSNRLSQLARSRRPDGPYLEINMNPANPAQSIGPMGFDPSLYVEEDPTSEWGFRAYGYWGGSSSSYACEMNPDLYTAIPGTQRGGSGENGFVPAGANSSGDNGGFGFFEAASMRVVEKDGVKKYVFIWAGHSGREFGLSQAYSSLRYAYGDHPLGPFKSGGVIVEARAPGLDQDGRMMYTFSYENTHGSIIELDNQWYVFYHRVTNAHNFSRQALVDPINIDITPEGDVKITGVKTITDIDGNYYQGVDVTSQGFEMDGLDPYKYYSAGYACWITPARNQDSNYTYVGGTWDIWNNDNPIVRIRNSSIVGYKYFNFTKQPGTNIDIHLTPLGQNFTIDIMMDTPWAAGTANAGLKIGELSVPANAPQVKTKYTIPAPILDTVEGSHAIFYVFRSATTNANLCEMNGIAFSTSAKAIDAPAPQPVLSILSNGNPLTMPAAPLRGGNFAQIPNVFYYDIQTSNTSGVVPVVTATSSDPSVKISVVQASTPTGTAVVRFTKDGLMKNYYVRFSGSALSANNRLPLPSPASSAVGTIVKGYPASVPITVVEGADLSGFYVKLFGKKVPIVDGKASLAFTADEIPDAVGTYVINVINEDGAYIMEAGSVSVVPKYKLASDFRGPAAATAVNNSDTAINNAFVILAVYNKDGRLTYSESKIVNVPAGGSAEAAFNVALSAYPYGDYTYAMFWWNSNYAPLIPAVRK